MTEWVATWGAAMHSIDSGNLPTGTTSMAGYTIRQQIRPTIPGDVLKLQISNMNGAEPLDIDAMFVAKLLDPAYSTINTATNIQVTYNGATSFTVPAGETIETDEIDISFTAFENIAVSVEIGDSAPATVTGHNGANCSSWFVSGDKAMEATLEGAEEKTSWYFIRMATTIATEDAGVIVAFGDSLTDGTGSTKNAAARWTDELARQLQSSGDLNNYGVVNMAEAGSLVQWNLGRVDRDIIQVPGIKAVVVYYGINDIANTDYDKYETMIGFYEEIITKCHNAGIKVYMATLTPTDGASDGYDNDMLIQIKASINDWIKSADCPADGYIDFEAAVADPNNPLKMQDSMVCGWYDWLHFNDVGYKALGETAFNTLKNELIP